MKRRRCLVLGGAFASLSDCSGTVGSDGSDATDPSNGGTVVAC